MKPSQEARIRSANAALLVAGELERIPEFFAPDYVAHHTAGELRGHDAIRRFLRALSKAFPRVEVEVEVLVRSRDRIAWHRTLRGVQSGAYKGFPASNRALVWRDVVTSRFENGRIAEEWVLTDLAEHLLRARKRQDLKGPRPRP